MCGSKMIRKVGVFGFVAVISISMTACFDGFGTKRGGGGSDGPSSSGSPPATTSGGGSTGGTGGGSGGTTTGGGGTTTGGGGTTTGGGGSGTTGSGSSSGGSGGTAGTFQKSVTIEGISRTYTYYVGTSAFNALANGPVPLLCFLHPLVGTPGDGWYTAQYYGVKAQCDAKGFILLVPDAPVGNSGWRNWFVNTSTGWPGTDGQSDSIRNNLKLVLQSLDEVKSKYNIDLKRMYCAGFSKGSTFTWIVAADSGISTVLPGYVSPFAAYGASSGGHPYNSAPTTSSPKRPIWGICGTNDSGNFSWVQSSVNEFLNAGWAGSIFTAANGVGHDWCWKDSYKPTYSPATPDDLFDWFLQHPLP